MKRADSLIFPLIRELGIHDRIRLIEIKNNWHILFQKPVSEHMSPHTVTEGEITLNVDSSVWLQELHFFRDDIIRKMSQYGIKAVRFKLGKVSAKANRKDTSSLSVKGRTKKLTSEELSYIDKTVSHISDESLRAAVKRSMIKAFTSGRTR